MKTRRQLLVLAAWVIGVAAAHAQLGIIKKIKQTATTAQGVVDMANGDHKFSNTLGPEGVYRSRTRQVILDKTHETGELKGKKVTYTFEKNGDVVLDDGQKVGHIHDNGTIDCHGTAGYIKLESNGAVSVGGDNIGHIDDGGHVYMFGVVEGMYEGMSKPQAAFLYYGICQTKENMAKLKQEQAERARQREEAAKRRAAMEASNNAAGRGGGSSQGKAREYSIQKGGARGFVDENGVVYNWAHKVVGRLPKGNGDITNASGSSIGRIWSGDIKDRSGNLVCHVTSGGSISVSGSNATVAEVRGGGRVDTTQGSKTLGYCDCRNPVWTAAIIFCNFFGF